MNTIVRWFFKPVPLGRVAALRTLAYLFIPVDLLVSSRWVVAHKDVPGDLYRPLYVGRLLHLPTPTHTLVLTVFFALLATSVLAAFNRAPRVLGIAVFALYFEWMIIANSYGKVDHDRFSYLVLLAVLPTIGRARWGDKTLSERAGWAMNLTQIAVVATYFFSSWAKLRFGGIGWLTGATLTRAVLRRGTVFSHWMLHVPHLLQLAQFGIVGFELLLSPVVLFIANDRLRYAVVGFFYFFHLTVYASVTIIFLPHLVAMASFLPLERVRPINWLLARVRGEKPADDGSSTPSDEPSVSEISEDKTATAKTSSSTVVSKAATA